MPILTRSVHDLSAASSRDIHRLVTASVHGGSSLYALDEEALAAARAGPHPDPGAVQGLRGELPRGQRRGPADRRRHHRRLARADLDRGDPQHDHDRRRDDRDRGQRDRPRREPARAARRGRGEGPGPSRGGRSVATRRRARVARPAVRVRSLGSRADPAGRWLGAPRLGRGAVGPDDVGRGLRGRPRDAAADAVRFPPDRDPRRVGARRDGRRATRTWRPCAAASVFALDGSAYFSRPGPRVIDGIELLAEIFDPDAFVDIAPLGSWTPVGP